MQKRAVFYVYVIFSEQSGQADVENGAMLTTYLFRYRLLQSAPIRSQIFEIFFAPRRQRGIDPLTKILRTFLNISSHSSPNGSTHYNVTQLRRVRAKDTNYSACGECITCYA